MEVPRQFYADATDKPFEHCQVCGKYLLAEGTSYVVEKAIRSYEGHEFYATAYEYAICTGCHQDIQKGMSEESMRKLQEYYNNFLEKRGQQPLVIDLRTFDLDSWLSRCFFSGEDIKGMKEYQLVGQFSGRRMLMNMPPLVIGEKVIEQMAGLLSDKTIDEMNGFRDKFLGPSPDIEELIFGKRLLLI
ncbi:MAG: hypothetical protein L3J66_06575 [Bacteroidales bacterium]|nr:hypothetical protein [Bacteroidales bacterium]